MLIVINARGSSGKDLFIEYIQEEIPCYNISSVDSIKEAGRILGWDGEKNEKGRLFLSTLKKLSTDFYNGPLTYLVDQLSYIPYGEIVFIHIREPEEINKFKALYPEETITLLVRRHNDDVGNSSDDDVENYQYDYYIDNSGTKEELKVKAIEFITTVLHKEV
jgi:hypothetical protein